MAKVKKLLDTVSESPKVKQVREALSKRIVGQEETMSALLDVVQKIESGLHDSRRPIGSILVTGPTGTGKTRIVEALCEAMFNDSRNMIKIDCGEFQHSHEIAKLIGSPPGYLGHRETKPLLYTEKIKMMSEVNKEFPVAVLLFDEIEKASDALWHLMLAILDKGEITTGTNEKVDLTKTVIIMTSNAGSSEMGTALDGGLGFRVPECVVNDEEIKNIGVEAAKRKFTTEFINRLDRIVACNSLTKEQIARVLDMEIEQLVNDIWMKTKIINLSVSAGAKAAIIEDGFDPKYNARHIKRSLEKHITVPIARVLATGQLENGDMVNVDVNDGKFEFQLMEPR